MDDERSVELECISAIFPEIVLDAANPYAAILELAVHPVKPVTVSFPSTNMPTPPPSENEDGSVPVPAAVRLESHDLTYLPSLKVQIVLPVGYPAEQPPQFTLSTSPEWLPQARLDELQASGERMWEEHGCTEVVYDFIDSLQQAAENAFGCGDGEAWEVPREYMISLMDFDMKAVLAAFAKGTFDCGTCLEPRKGLVCHKMADCGHVFCVECLQTYYSGYITAGDITSVRCLEFGCAKERAEQQVKKKKTRKPNTQISPSELRQIPIENDLVVRYVRLKRKAELESDKDTIYCPRKWCQGAAKSKKHPKEGTESEGESDSDQAKAAKKKFKSEDLLSICEDCDYAFCSRCLQGWHGEFARCMPPRATAELSEEEKASQDYILLHTTPCPTCTAPAQKTHGCNHMICYTCNTHFCYLCSAWLDPTNPYQHFNDIKTGCYQRLWELEAGDGDDVGIGFEGGPHDRAPVAGHAAGHAADANALAAEQAAFEHMEEIVEAIEEMEAEVEGNVQAAEPVAPVPQLQREGPLVLRINAAPPVPVAPAPAVPDPPARVRNNGRRRQLNGPNRMLPRVAPRRELARPMDRGHAREIARNQAHEEQIAQEQEEANQRWMQRFLAAAANDEEDLLESDDEDGDDAVWRIPEAVR